MNVNGKVGTTVFFDKWHHIYVIPAQSGTQQIRHAHSAGSSPARERREGAVAEFKSRRHPSFTSQINKLICPARQI
jgi:hypothetical protein